MSEYPHIATPIEASLAIWLVWAISWMLAAVWSSRAAARAPSAAHLPHWLLTVAGFGLLFGAAQSSFGRRVFWRHTTQFWDVPTPVSWLLTALVAAGFLFAWWARIHLGTLWSGTITRKEGHHVVDTGPYRLVRHPIYTGLIASGFALALQTGYPSALIGAALIAVGYWVKARLEERFLSVELGEVAYGDYRERTPMLVPFVRFPN